MKLARTVTLLVVALLWWAFGPVVLVLALLGLCLRRVRAWLRPTRRVVVRWVVVVLAVAGLLWLVPDGWLPLPPGPGALVAPSYVGRPAIVEADHGGARSIIDGRYKLLVQDQKKGGVKRELFDLEADPGEKTDLAAQKRFKDEVLARLFLLNAARAEEEKRLGISRDKSAAKLLTHRQRKTEKNVFLSEHQKKGKPESFSLFLA